MTAPDGRHLPSLRGRILVAGTGAALLTAGGLAVLLGLSGRTHARLSAATEAFLVEQRIANRITQTVMQQLLVVSAARAGGGRATLTDFQVAGDSAHEQLRLYLFRELTGEERIHVESMIEEHQRLEVAAARSIDLYTRGEAEAGNEAFEEMGAHGSELLEAVGAFLRMREEGMQGLRRRQNETFRALYVAGGTFGAMLLVGFVALGRFFIRRVDAPLSQLATAARRIEMGDLDARLPEASDREIATVAESFNRMARQVAEARHRLEEKVAERTAALQSSETRFRTVATTAPDAIITADRDGRITYFNPGAERIFGHDAALVIGRPLTLLMPERLREPHLRGLARYVSTGEARVVGRTLELVGLHREGSEFPLELSLASWSHDGVPAFTAVIRDITERRKIDEDLRRYAAELEVANEELEAFAYSVSHDLRAPLRGVHGFSVAVLEEYEEDLDERGVHYLRRVCAAAEQMGVLIDDLLELSRASRAEMEPEPVDVSEMARRIASQLSPAAPERSVDFRIDEGLTAWADRGLLTLLLRNLMDNAWKFTGRKAHASIEVGRSAENDGALFVRDDGAGFEMKYADKLFDPFQRLHSTREFEGTGIGLALVQRIVRRHGGRVWAEGAVERGATFYFTLPSP